MKPVDLLKERANKLTNEIIQAFFENRDITNEVSGHKVITIGNDSTYKIKFKIEEITCPTK